MKKAFLLSSLLALGAVASYGATACAITPILVTSATTCEIGNLIFSNFTTSGSPDPNMTVTYGITNFPTDTNYVVNFQDPNDISASFGVAYSVTVDQTTLPANGDGKWAI